MSTVLNGYGLRPVYAQSHFADPRRYDFGIASGYATSLFQYQPVAVNASGQIVAASVAADFIGVFMGVTYFDATGIPHSYNQWISGTVVQTGQPFWVWVNDDQYQIYQIQADGVLSSSSSSPVNGAQLNFTASNIGTGNTVTGLSNATASAASLTTSGQGQLRITELAPSPALNGANLWNDAYPEIRVQIARHQYVANKTAV